MLDEEYYCKMEIVHMLVITLEGTDQLLAKEWKEFEADGFFFIWFTHYCIRYFQNMDCVLKYGL